MSDGDGADEVVSKGDFARLSNVSPGRVTQWIAEGKISGDALVGEGRSARIRVRTAQAQLKRHLDPNQMTANGIRTRIPTGPLVVAPCPVAVTQPGPKLEAERLTLDTEPVVSVDPDDEAVAADLTLERAGLAREQKLNWRLRNREKIGELIEAADAERRWADEMVKLRSRMLGVTSDLPQLLPTLTKHELQIIDRAIRDAMTEAAATDDDAA